MSHEGLLTSVVGSHAHPGWFASGLAMTPHRMKEDPR